MRQSLRYFLALLFQFPSTALLVVAISYHKLLIGVYCIPCNADEGIDLILTVELFHPLLTNMHCRLQ